jgi:biopolymer transport protein ExbD
MEFRSRNKIEVGFSMASMTDLIFLLLIFFMLTSSFITPSGLPISLPTTKEPVIIQQKVTVTISADLQYMVNDKPTTLANLKADLEPLLSGSPSAENLVVLHIDRTVPVEYLVNVADIATTLKAKVSIATKPKE